MVAEVEGSRMFTSSGLAQEDLSRSAARAVHDATDTRAELLILVDVYEV